MASRPFHPATVPICEAGSQRQDRRVGLCGQVDDRHVCAGEAASFTGFIAAWLRGWLHTAKIRDLE
jgi:hypothetical protein